VRLIDVSLGGDRVLQKLEVATGLELTVVIPTLNEEKNIPIIFEKVSNALKGVNWEMVIVDDNSTDRSPEVMREMARKHHNFRFIRRIGRSGLSTASIEGMLTSSAPFIAVMDADGQHEEAKLIDMLSSLRADQADIAVGSRFAEGADLGEFASSRTKLSLTGNSMISKAFGIPLRDSLGGFFMLKREMFEEVVPGLSGRGFKILFDILAGAPDSCRVAEIPIKFGAREHGESKLSPLIMLDFFLQMWDRKLGKYLPTKAVIDIGSIVSFTLISTFIEWVIMKISYAVTGTFPDAALILPFATIPSIALSYRIQRALTPKRKRTKGGGMVKEFLAYGAICLPFILLTMWITSGLIQPGDPRLRMLFGASLTSSVGMLIASNWRKETVLRR
jgi:dolichol-phosphate mannosyltransferase